MNASRYRKPRVVTRATLVSGCCQSYQNGVRDVLNARVNSHLVEQFWIDLYSMFQVSLEVCSVSPPEIMAMRWVLKA